MKEFFSIFKNSLTRKCMALLMSLLVVGAASAQTRVTGTVTDESGHPLMGVTVIVVGTNTGAITNLQGQYSIAAKPGNTLVTLVEGFSKVAIPRIEIFRPALGKKPMYPGDDYIEAVASDREKPDNLPRSVTWLDLNKENQVVDWLLNRHTT